MWGDGTSSPLRWLSKGSSVEGRSVGKDEVAFSVGADAEAWDFWVEVVEVSGGADPEPFGGSEGARFGLM